jgi:AcrR family transcriptional regulator
MSASTKKELGRQRILDAAREVFAEQGLEGASLRAIAARAGYTPAALYFHFDSREAIYAELLRASLADLAAAIQAAAHWGERVSRRCPGALRLLCGAPAGAGAGPLSRPRRPGAARPGAGD